MGVPFNGSDLLQLQYRTGESPSLSPFFQEKSQIYSAYPPIPPLFCKWTQSVVVHTCWLMKIILYILLTLLNHNPKHKKPFVYETA